MHVHVCACVCVFPCACRYIFAFNLLPAICHGHSAGFEEGNLSPALRSSQPVRLAMCLGKMGFGFSQRHIFVPRPSLVEMNLSGWITVSLCAGLKTHVSQLWGCAWVCTGPLEGDGCACVCLHTGVSVNVCLCVPSLWLSVCPHLGVCPCVSPNTLKMSLSVFMDHA